VSDEHVIEGDGGTITVSPGALTQVVVRAAEDVDGVRVRRPRRGLAIDVADERVRVELELVVALGGVIPDLARGVQERVADALRRMCGLEVEAIDVAVEEVEE